MSKSILIRDTPKNCGECDLVCDDCSGLYCVPVDRYFDKNDSIDERPSWCPFRKLPDKKDYKKLSNENQMKAWGNGWNACLNAITGEAQDE